MQRYNIVCRIGSNMHVIGECNSQKRLEIEFCEIGRLDRKFSPTKYEFGPAISMKMKLAANGVTDTSFISVLDTNNNYQKGDVLWSKIDILLKDGQ